MVDEERRNNGGGSEYGGAVVDTSGAAVSGFPIEVKNQVVNAANGVPIEVEDAHVDAMNELAIEVENVGVNSKNRFAIEVENGVVNATNGVPNEVEDGAVDAMNGVAIEVENGVVNAANGVPIELEDGAVDAVNDLAIEVENGVVNAANGVPTEVEDVAVCAMNGLAIEVENGGVNTEHRCANGAVYAVNRIKIEDENWSFGNGNSAGSSCEGLRTYKRRRHMKMGRLETKLPEYGQVSADSFSRRPDKSVEEPFDSIRHDSSNEQFSLHRSSDDFPQNCCKKTVLEQMYQSLCKSEGGLQSCIQHALRSYPQSSCKTAAKGSVHSGDVNHKTFSQTGWIANGTHDASRGNMIAMPNGSLTESTCSNTNMCSRAFVDIVISEKFSELCGLLLENFQGIKVDSFLDVSLINSRMKEGAYESSPVLFHSDMQQLWTKLQNVGAEMVSLGKSLSDKSRTSYHEQQFRTGEPDSHTNLEQTEACGASYIYACRHCGEKSKGRDCLVCDSCEELYHVSCIEPAVKEIPSKSWYCAKCTTTGIDEILKKKSSHDDCVVCEKMNASINPNNEVEENANNLSKHGVPIVNGGETFHKCCVCDSKVDNGNRFVVCGHPFCPHNHYHVKCLTRQQLNTHGPCWYCPSCLCRQCLTDRDDEKIVLCDGCDHAYHIYCMTPPRSSIPRKKWFCRTCDTGIQRIRKAKRAYENLQNRLTERGEDGRGTYENLVKKRREELIDNSGGVDMLLTAAKTLNFEEKMDGIEMKR